MSTLIPVASAARTAVTREQLILSHTPLVRRAVRQFAVNRPSTLEPEDIYSYGTMGLIDAVDRFDQTRGVKFETYAVNRIRGFLLDQLREMDWLPRSARANVKLVQQATSRMEEQLGRKPATHELAEETGLPNTACDRALVDEACRVVSLDSISVTDSGESVLSLRVVDEQSPNPALTAERYELRQGIVDALAGLPQREGEVLRLRYANDCTHREIATRLGVSESRVSQLHAQGIARMRQTLVGRFGDLSMAQLSA
ncbi:MAG: whiG [Chloroflexi bacterium]|jgi:RNA polymerase sigma factor for flagellar operon FliA|nr:whiG [Chloroflexota bacterium]